MQENGRDSPEKPMHGIRVLELGTTIAGPFCARLLADFGAEVIKVESAEGDPIRTSAKRYKDKPLYATSLMRNKKLIVIDLRTAAGQDLVRRFVKKCDVVIENFRPGTLEKWGLGYEALSQINPGLVLVRVSGYGQTGPYSQRPGYGVVCEAVGGLRHVTGDADRPPARANIALTDCITGLYAAFGTMMALRHRERTGEGQVVDTALYECAFSFMEAHIAAYEKTGYVVGREGAGHTGSVVNNLFQTRDGHYVHVQGSQTNSFRRLCLAMGRPDILDDPRFNTRLERVKNGDEMDGMVAAWIGARDYEAVEKALSAEDVVFTRIYTMADIFRDPHFKARGMIPSIPDEELGTVAMAAPVPRLTRTPGAIHKSGGRIGRDTFEVLHDMLGLSAGEIEQLEHDRIISTKPPAAVKRGGKSS
ncbi:MAG: CoA transferase [Burkholderiales bacterium]|nr:CoA transferase [Burkholderiales bacterium]